MEYKNSLDIACGHTNNLQIIKFIHNNGGTCTTSTMDYAASNGSLSR